LFQLHRIDEKVPLAEQLGVPLVLPCDVEDIASVDAVFETLRGTWGRLDFLVHAIAYADKQYLRGRYVDMPRAAFLQAMDISCYSLLAVAQRALPLMKPALSEEPTTKAIPRSRAFGKTRCSAFS